MIDNRWLGEQNPVLNMMSAACRNLGIEASRPILESCRNALSHNLPVFDAIQTDPETVVSLRKEVAALMELPYLDEISLHEHEISNVVSIVSATDSENAGVVPIQLESMTEERQFGILTLATSDPFNGRLPHGLKINGDYGIRTVIADPEAIEQARERLYGIGGGTIEGIVSSQNLNLDDLNDVINELEGDDDDATVVRFVNQLIKGALEQGSSDIHIEPLEDDLMVRYRVDGDLIRQRVPQRINELKSALLSRIKVMSGLDIGEKRLPQDGRINLGLRGARLDVRVATIPGVHGESVSLRLLHNQDFSLADLGMLDRERGIVDKLLTLPNGIVLITGPTGSGKSTSLYSFLKSLDTERLRIVTIEDPVENKLEGVHQIAVNSEIGLTFAKGLRSILRGDPNVVMVGEIRDEETAEIALRAALTGHLVFSTLHTNDALGAVERLVDMGMEPFFVAAALKGVIGQRLVRKRCQDCVSFPVVQSNCPQCRGSGFKGRQGIFEVCEIDESIQGLIESGSKKSDLVAAARQGGFRTMREYGTVLAGQGITSNEEVLGATIA